MDITSFYKKISYLLIHEYRNIFTWLFPFNIIIQYDCRKSQEIVITAIINL